MASDSFLDVILHRIEYDVAVKVICESTKRVPFIQ